MIIRLGRLKQGNHSFNIESGVNILARKLAGIRHLTGKAGGYRFSHPVSVKDKRDGSNDLKQGFVA